MAAAVQGAAAQRGRRTLAGAGAVGAVPEGRAGLGALGPGPAARTLALARLRVAGRPVLARTLLLAFLTEEATIADSWGPNK